jgi:hypothetical protein
MNAHPGAAHSLPMQGRDPESLEQLRALGYID